MPKRGDKFPHFQFDINDVSRRPLPAPAAPGLHQPVFFGFAEKGPLNVPTKGSIAFLSRIYGEKTFETRSKYFHHPNLYARFAGGYQEIWFVRLGDENMAKASLVLEASTKTVDMIQYQKDTFGARLLDGEGDPLPVLEVDGVTPVTEPGLELTWGVRAIDTANDETLTNLQPVTTMDGDDEVTTYPIVAFEADSFGSAGNLAGFKLWFDPEFTESVVENIGALTYQFAPMLLDDLTNNALPVRDIYQAGEISVALKRDALDTSVNQYYDLEERVRNQYTSTDGNAPHSLIPMSLHVYDQYVEAIGDAVVALSPELVGTDAFMINILSGMDTANHHYDHFQTTNDANFVNANRVNYLTGGSDGQIKLANLEALYIDYMGGSVYPEISDEARYPFTHIYDSGFSIDAKMAMINFGSFRKDVKFDLATQDVSLVPNGKAEDQSTGAALRAAALLHPESTFFGTPAIRYSIYQQCGRLASDPTYQMWVPMTLDRMVKRCMYEATSQSRGQPTGLPNAAVTMFSEINWTPSSDDQKRLNWSTALNYVQHYDTTGVHFADYRSVYPYDDSVLSDDILVDRLVYIKHMCRIVWATYVGRREPAETLFDLISKDIDKRIFTAFNSEITSETTVYKTEEDEALGYKNTVQVRILSPMPNRVLDIIVPVDRME